MQIESRPHIQHRKRRREFGHVVADTVRRGVRRCGYVNKHVARPVGRLPAKDEVGGASRRDGHRKSRKSSPDFCRHDIPRPGSGPHQSRRSAGAPHRICEQPLIRKSVQFVSVSRRREWRCGWRRGRMRCRGRRQWRERGKWRWLRRRRRRWLRPYCIRRRHVQRRRGRVCTHDDRDTHRDCDRQHHRRSRSGSRLTGAASGGGGGGVSWLLSLLFVPRDGVDRQAAR